MWNIVWVILFAVVAHAQQKYKLCAPVDTINDNACLALQRGDSEVLCLRVADSAECAIRLAQGEADFGIFNAEEMLLAYKFYPSNITPILELRHKQKQLEAFEFQTVAVVPAVSPQNAIAPGQGLDRLKNNGLCHPGFSQSQWWNDYILKYFEKTIHRPSCQEDVSVIENELRGLKDFFGKACRPGEWVADRELDQKLKKKYPELCALCDDKASCTYNDNRHHGHYGAMDCLANRRGKVAYVALSYVQDYFKTNDTFEFLCPDGTTLPLTSPTPCSWLKQPWSAVVARRELAEHLRTKLSEWLNAQMLASVSWKTTVSEIIQEDSVGVNITEKSLAAYLSRGRDIDLANAETCDRTVRWCTIGDLETNKCEWVARAAIALGIEPRISCLKKNSTFQCFRDIAAKQADIMAIDSNYGYLARKVYSLSTVLYCETEMEKNSVITAVVREPKDNNYPITSFHDLTGKTACFSEYGGIGWLSFINTVRTNGAISSRSCDYPLLVSKLLSGACTPGIKDADHLRTTASADVSSKLCSACTHRNNTSCAANETNLYYGDKGALRCLADGAGDIAIVEAGNILDETIDTSMYRVLCKNGSLAQRPGFNFDDMCALSITIDSEVVGRKNDLGISETDITLALLKIEDWLGYRVNAQRPIHVYGPFNGTKNLLFKDSTSGLVPKTSLKNSVEAYRNLFRHVDTCSTGTLTTTANFIFVALVAIYHFLLNQAQY